jgi:hypothetical protein
VVADDRAEEGLELSIEVLEERLTPGGSVKKTAGWGC